MTVIGGKPFDRGDVLSSYGRDLRDAGPGRLAVDMDGAGATQRHAAAELGAGHPQVIAQNPQQGHLRNDVDGLRFSVQSKFNGSHTGLLSDTSFSIQIDAAA